MVIVAHHPVGLVAQLLDQRPERLGRRLVDRLAESRPIVPSRRRHPSLSRRRCLTDRTGSWRRRAGPPGLRRREPRGLRMSHLAPRAQRRFASRRRNAATSPHCAAPRRRGEGLGQGQAHRCSFRPRRLGRPGHGAHASGASRMAELHARRLCLQTRRARGFARVAHAQRRDACVCSGGAAQPRGECPDVGLSRVPWPQPRCRRAPHRGLTPAQLSEPLSHPRQRCPHGRPAPRLRLPGHRGERLP